MTTPRQKRATDKGQILKMATGTARWGITPAKLHRALLVAAVIYLAMLPASWATAARSIAFASSAALALWILALSRSGRYEHIPSPGSAILAALLAWSACAVASVTWSVHLAYTLREFRHELSWGLLTMTIFYVAAHDREAWRTLIATVLASFALLAGLAGALAALPGGWNPARWHAGGHRAGPTPGASADPDRPLATNHCRRRDQGHRQSKYRVRQ